MKGPILVFGPTGQVGTEVMCRQSISPAPLVGAARATADVGRRADVERVFAEVRPAIVINAAAYTAVDKAEAEPHAAFAVNRDGAGHIAVACAAAGIPLVHLSTDYVFDGCKAELYRESDIPAPLGAYGASKWAGEEEIRANLAQHVIVRTAWVFSAHRSNFLKTVLRLSSELPELRIVDDQKGGPTAAADIAEAVLSIAAQISHGRARWGTYHYCGGPTTTWHGFAGEIVAAASSRGGNPVSVRRITGADYPTRARRPANSALDCTKIATTFGLAQPDWRVRVAETVAILRGAGGRQ